jgi:hypothetical protein
VTNTGAEVAGNLTVTGTTTTVNADNLLVKDKLITLNDGGLADSGNGVGIEVEEDGGITGYLKVKNDRSGWDVKAPSSASVLSVVPTASSVLSLGANVTVTATLAVDDVSAINQSVKTDASPTFAGLALANGNITSGGSIQCDKVYPSVAGDGLEIDFSTGDTTKNKLILKDNQADALNIVEGSNSYMKFVTTNGLDEAASGYIQVSKPIDASAAGFSRVKDLGFRNVQFGLTDDSGQNQQNISVKAAALANSVCGKIERILLRNTAGQQNSEVECLAYATGHDDAGNEAFNQVFLNGVLQQVEYVGTQLGAYSGVDAQNFILGTANMGHNSEDGKLSKLQNNVTDALLLRDATGNLLVCIPEADLSDKDVLRMIIS